MGKQYRLLIKIKDKSRPSMKGTNGQEMIPVKWVEVEGPYNFGSLKSPSGDEVIEFKLEPIYNNPFGRLFE